LVPYWAKDPAIGNQMINAGSDSLLTKPAFKRAAVKRRCLIPADGWFEWQHNPDHPGKQSFYMTPEDGSELAFAGLWEYWRHEDQRILRRSICLNAGQTASPACTRRDPIGKLHPTL
jgi:putative SOS response-associated peptidase YedK